MRPKPIFLLRVALFICWRFVWSAGIVIGSQPAQNEAGVDLLLLVDASDSMRVLDEERLTDQITRSVLRYLVEDFPGDNRSRVGIICFSFRDDEAKITPLLKLTPLSEVDLEQVSVECERGDGTHFVKILEEAPDFFRAEPRPGNRKVILLITDGHPSVAGESVLEEDEVNRNYLLGNVVPKISELQDLDEKPALHVIGVGETKFVDFWSQYNFTRVEDSDHLLRIGALLAELFPVAPPPSPTLTPTFTPSPAPSPTFTPVPPTSTPSPTPSPTSTSVPTSIPSPSPTSTPAPTSTPSPSPTETPSLLPSLTSTPTSTVTLTNTPTPSPTPTPTLGIVGPVVTPTATATTRPGGVVMPWSGVGIVVLLIAALVGGLAVTVLLLKDAKKEFRDATGKWEEEKEKREKTKEDLEALKQARRGSELEQEAERAKILLQEAREAFNEGEIGQACTLAEQVIENVTRYGELVLERMAAYTREALDIILQATLDISEYFQAKSVVIQRGLADGLKVWWAHHPNEAIEGIYDLMSKGGQDLLKLVGEREALWPEGVPEVVKNNAREVENICKSLHSLLSQESDENLPSLLDEVVRAFAAASETFAHAGDAQALYQCMAQLAKHPLWPVKFPAPSDKSLPYFRNVARLLQQGFSLPSPAWEGLPQLKQLEREVSSHAE